jgi:CRP-like cAMP-binding protein
VVARTSRQPSRTHAATPGRPRRPTGVANILELDPELGEGLAPQRFALALERSQAACLDLPRGPLQEVVWPEPVRRGPGLLMLDGLLLRRIELSGRWGAELLAAGDLLRPWDREDSLASVPHQTGWRVLERSRIAVLDIDFARRIAAFPEIYAELVSRALRRQRQLAVNIAIVHQPRVEVRVHMILWQLADRWGTVRQDGVLLPLRLTHTLLAELVAARRPTVSAAITTLERGGEISRPPEGWLLHGRPPGERSTSRPNA